MKSAPTARTATKLVQPPGPRRRPEGGGYARGDEVRSRILLAAIQMFGEQGFASASTRAIAARAGVNPPALQYYFHNKERLHQACGQYLADRIKGHLEESMAGAAEALRTADRAAVPRVLWALIESVVDHSSNETEIPGWCQFLAQAAADMTDTSLALIHNEAVQPLFETMAALVALAWDRPAEDQTARLAAILLMSQTRAFGIQQQGALAMLGWPDFEHGRLDAGKRCLKALVLRLIATALPD
jgi:TetR/AcrR family transcriptional regulator, regulator of cefoperazone and chloramphenicol sensitivity